MNDVGVLEAAHHLNDGAGLADIGEKFVPQAFSFAGAAHKTGNVVKFDDGRRDLDRMKHIGEDFEARIGHFHHADVGFDRAERIVRGVRPGGCDGIEKRALAHVRQTYNT